MQYALFIAFHMFASGILNKRQLRRLHYAALFVLCMNNARVEVMHEIESGFTVVKGYCAIFPAIRKIPKTKKALLFVELKFN